MKRIAISDHPPRRRRLYRELVAFVVFYAAIGVILLYHLAPFWWEFFR